MRKIKFHPEARKELRHETLFYKKAGQTTGKRFVNEVIRASEQIQKNPEMWQSISDRMRGNILSRFPFTFIYAYNDELIFIVALAHHRKSPGYWRDRVKDIPF